MRKEAKNTMYTSGIFLLIIIIWNAIVLGIVNILYHGIPTEKTIKLDSISAIAGL